MKVGLFIDTFFPMVDGVINVVDNYARELSKYCEVTVFCPLVDKTKMDNLPYKVVQCNSFSVKNLDYEIPTPQIDIEFIKALKNSDLDIVHIHSPFTVGEIGKAYAKKKNIPLVATIHSQYKKDFDRTIKGKLPVKIATTAIMNIFNSCDLCWAVNSGIMDLYVHEYGLIAPCEVKTNATDHRPIEDVKNAKNEIDNEYGISPELPVYLFVGRINFLKNIELIVESLSVLKERGKKFRMLFVGSGQDEEKLRKLILEKGLLEEVILCGKITQKNKLEKLYARAKLFLFPSLYDANSLVQIESACQSTPTLFLRGAKTATGIIDGENGFLSENDPYSFASKIIEIEENEDLYKRVCENAKRQLYVTWEEVIKSVYLDYISLITNKA